MKVKTTIGGFFYDGRIIGDGEELDVPSAVGRSWLAAGIAAEPSRSKPKAGITREGKGPAEATVQTGPPETTVAPGPKERRG